MTPQPEMSLESEKKRLDPHVCDPEFVACEVEVETTPSFWRPQSGPLEYFEPPKTFTEPVKKPARQRYYIPKRSDLWKIQGFLDALDSSDLSDDSSDDTDPAHNDSDNVMSPKKRPLQNNGSSDRNASESSQEREPVQLSPPVSDVNKPVQRDQRESITIIELCSDDEPLQKKSRSADKPKDQNVMVKNLEPSTRSRSPSVKKPSEPESGNSSEQQKANEESKNVEDSSNKNNDKSEKPSRSDRSKLQNKVTPSEAPPKAVIESPVAPQSAGSLDAADQLATMPRENAETEVIGTVVTPQTPRKLPPPQLEDVQEDNTGLVATPQGITSPPEPQHEKPQEEITDKAGIPHGQPQSFPQHQLDSIIEQDFPNFGGFLDSLDGFYKMEQSQTEELLDSLAAFLHQQGDMIFDEINRHIIGPYKTHCAIFNNADDSHKEAIASFPLKLGEITSHYMSTRSLEKHDPLMAEFREACRTSNVMNDQEKRQAEQKILSELRSRAETEFHKQIVEVLEVLMAPKFQRSAEAIPLPYFSLSARNGQDPMQSTSGPSTSDYQPSFSNSGQSTSYGQWHGQ